jgi:hypothetical protein
MKAKHKMKLLVCMGGGIHGQQPKLWGGEGESPFPSPHSHSQNFLLGFNRFAVFCKLQGFPKNKVKDFDFSLFAFSLKIFIFAKNFCVAKINKWGPEPEPPSSLFQPLTPPEPHSVCSSIS